MQTALITKDRAAHGFAATIHAVPFSSGESLLIVSRNSPFNTLSSAREPDDRLYSSPRRFILDEMAESTLEIGFWNWKFFNSVLADLVSYVHRFFVGVEKERQKSSDDLLEGVVLEDSPR